MTVSSVSVILPTYNRIDRLRRVLAALEAQRDVGVPFEVVVVSDGSTDGTGDVMRTMVSPLSIRFVEQTNGGAAAARNTGVQLATGDLLLFIDDDVVPAPDLLREHVASHCTLDVVVIGPMLSPPDFRMQGWVQWEQAMLCKQYDDMAQGRWQPTARQFFTGNASVARRWLLDAGGFDTTFRRAEDVELGYRLADRGLRFVFNARAIGWHYAERSFASWLETPYQYGRNDVVFAREKRQQWMLPTVQREFSERNALIRMLVYSCIDRPAIVTLASTLLRLLARVGPVSRPAYSSLFNLRYYQGVADEMGGRDVLLTLFHRGVAPSWSAPMSDRL